MFRHGAKLTILVGVILVLIGCATTQSFQNLSLGTTKGEVTKAIGKPYVVRGAMQNKYGQTIEVWEYRPARWTMDAVAYYTDRYWLYFVEDKLVQWGQAGDWSREADRIYEIRFGPSAPLTAPQ